MHVREDYSSLSVCQFVCLSVCLCTADLEGCCIAMVETDTNMKKMMI